MISKQDCHILNSCHRDYIGHGVSPYNASSGVLVLVGRPYGGVGFMWKNSLDEYVTIMTYIYVSSAWGTKYWLDHIVCTADAMSCVSKMEILYNCKHSDHHPFV